MSYYIEDFEIEGSLVWAPTTIYLEPPQDTYANYVFVEKVQDPKTEDSYKLVS